MRPNPLFPTVRVGLDHPIARLRSALEGKPRAASDGIEEVARIWSATVPDAAGKARARKFYETALRTWLTHKSPNTRRSYAGTLAHFLDFTSRRHAAPDATEIPLIAPHQVRQDDVDAFVHALSVSAPPRPETLTDNAERLVFESLLGAFKPEERFLKEQAEEALVKDGVDKVLPSFHVTPGFMSRKYPDQLHLILADLCRKRMLVREVVEHAVNMGRVTMVFDYRIPEASTDRPTPLSSRVQRLRAMASFWSHLLTETKLGMSQRPAELEDVNPWTEPCQRLIQGRPDVDLAMAAKRLTTQDLKRMFVQLRKKIVNQKSNDGLSIGQVLAARDAMAIVFFVTTGLRRSEAMQARMENVKPAPGAFSGGDTPLMIVDGITRKGRKQPEAVFFPEMVLAMRKEMFEFMDRFVRETPAVLANFKVDESLKSKLAAGRRTYYAKSFEDVLHHADQGPLIPALGRWGNAVTKAARHPMSTGKDSTVYRVPMDGNSLLRRMVKLARGKQELIVKYHPHALRHLAVSMAESVATGATMAQAMAGHRSATTTNLYRDRAGLAAAAVVSVARTVRLLLAAAHNQALGLPEPPAAPPPPPSAPPGPGPGPGPTPPPPPTPPAPAAPPAAPPPPAVVVSPPPPPTPRPPPPPRVPAVTVTAVPLSGAPTSPPPGDTVSPPPTVTVSTVPLGPTPAPPPPGSDPGPWPSIAQGPMVTPKPKKPSVKLPPISKVPSPPPSTPSPPRPMIPPKAPRVAMKTAAELLEEFERGVVKTAEQVTLASEFLAGKQKVEVLTPAAVESQEKGAVVAVSGGDKKPRPARKTSLSEVLGAIRDADWFRDASYYSGGDKTWKPPVFVSSSDYRGLLEREILPRTDVLSPFGLPKAWVDARLAVSPRTQLAYLMAYNKATKAETSWRADEVTESPIFLDKKMRKNAPPTDLGVEEKRRKVAAMPGRLVALPIVDLGDAAWVQEMGAEAAQAWEILMRSDPGGAKAAVSWMNVILTASKATGKKLPLSWASTTATIFKSGRGVEENLKDVHGTVIRQHSASEITSFLLNEGVIHYGAIGAGVRFDVQAGRSDKSEADMQAALEGMSDFQQARVGSFLKKTPIPEWVTRTDDPIGDPEHGLPKAEREALKAWLRSFPLAAASVLEFRSQVKSMSDCWGMVGVFAKDEGATTVEAPPGSEKEMEVYRRKYQVDPVVCCRRALRHLWEIHRQEESPFASRKGVNMRQVDHAWGMFWSFVLPSSEQVRAMLVEAGRDDSNRGMDAAFGALSGLATMETMVARMAESVETFLRASDDLVKGAKAGSKEALELPGRLDAMATEAGHVLAGFMRKHHGEDLDVAKQELIPEVLAAVSAVASKRYGQPRRELLSDLKDFASFSTRTTFTSVKATLDDTQGRSALAFTYIFLLRKIATKNLFDAHEIEDVFEASTGKTLGSAGGDLPDDAGPGGGKPSEARLLEDQNLSVIRDKKESLDRLNKLKDPDEIFESFQNILTDVLAKYGGERKLRDVTLSPTFYKHEPKVMEVVNPLVTRIAQAEGKKRDAVILASKKEIMLLSAALLDLLKSDPDMKPNRAAPGKAVALLGGVRMLRHVKVRLPWLLLLARVPAPRLHVGGKASRRRRCLRVPGEESEVNLPRLKAGASQRPHGR